MADTMSMVVGVREEQGNTAQSNVQEERIFVAIRVRPLNERERARHDVSDWECISHNTIKFKNNGLAEQRSLSMDTYTFDRVFGEMCSTQQVYEQGIKEVALSVVSGINSSIFAYGQTSSGKTYTMTGITEYAIRDIYEYIEKHREREFVVKFSAMEIYNEAVRDLLNVNATSLRLLDDPENFVDLAGSERASQTLSAGTRLREGSHINRSLLTLGTVIRKLSQVEQSKNTLFFAGCAKQVTTNAQVNVVKSDKVLVKQLQKELARMENELRSFSTIILKERELQIEQMDKEIKELTRQRDHFQSHVENLLQSVGKDQLSKADKDGASESSGVGNNLRPGADRKSENLNRTTSSLSISNENLLQQQPENSEDNFLLDGCSPTFVGPDPCQGWEEMASRAESEDNCKEVTCIEIKEVETDHKTDVNTSIPALKKEDDQDALQQETQELQSTNNLLGLGDLSERSNGSSESGSHSLAAISPPQIDEADHETSSHPQFSELEQNVSPSGFKEVPCIEIKEVETDHKTDVNIPTPAFEERGGNSPMIQVVDVDAKSSLGNGHGDQDTLQQETEVDLPEKSNGSSESGLHILPATSPKIGKVDQETSLPPQSSKLEENVSPSRFNKREQEPASPHQFDEQELKTMSPPQLDELERVSFTLPAGFEREYSSGFVYFQDELSEPKLRSIKGKSSRKHSPIHEMDASVEDLESVLDSDTEDTASVLNLL
ncbi:P-loop containing nucleoside triphosphate hydrolase [Sesbania bispinosa]|nr:P-loop containing nucleoside triphosphate hydrolase [Sesbania bispinosa]